MLLKPTLVGVFDCGTVRQLAPVSVRLQSGKRTMSFSWLLASSNCFSRYLLYWSDLILGMHHPFP